MSESKAGNRVAKETKGSLTKTPKDRAELSPEAALSSQKRKASTQESEGCVNGKLSQGTYLSTKKAALADVSAAANALDEDYVSARFLANVHAADRIQAAAANGDHLAEAYLSIVLDRGCVVVRKDAPRSAACAQNCLAWLRENAHAGNPHAQFNLAMCFSDGRGVEADPSEAFRLFKLAAALGQANSRTVPALSVI